MKTIKMKFQIDNTPSITFWEEATVSNDINAEEYYTIMIENFNKTLRPDESSRTILEIVDPTIKNKSKTLKTKAGNDDRQKMKLVKKDYGYRNSFDGIKYQRLRKKVKKDHNLDMPEFAVRQYGGKWVKGHGAWSWFTIAKGMFDRVFGSQESVTMLLKYHCLDVSLNSVGEYDIDGLNPCRHPKEKKK